MIDVTALGELLIDFTPYGTADDGCHLFGRNPGGAPANLLATVSRYGGKTALITKVGSDIFGDFLIDVLRKNKISTEGVVRDDIHNTTLAFVELNAEGDRSFSFYRRFGADIFLTPEEVNSELIRNSRYFISVRFRLRMSRRCRRLTARSRRRKTADVLLPTIPITGRLCGLMKQ